MKKGIIIYFLLIAIFYWEQSGADIYGPTSRALADQYSSDLAQTGLRYRHLQEDQRRHKSAYSGVKSGPYSSEYINSNNIDFDKFNEFRRSFSGQEEDETK